MSVYNKYLLSLSGCIILLLNYNVASSQTDTVLVANAGSDNKVCGKDSVTIGGQPAAKGGHKPYTYSWNPSIGLSNPNMANPRAHPGGAISYTLTVTDSLHRSANAIVRIKVFPSPTVTIGSNQTILQGKVTTLSAGGAVHYYWSPPDDLTGPNTANPVASPRVTTIYTVVGEDVNGCLDWKVDTIFVIKNDTLIKYNAFTPNYDGYNDYFYIGNLENYPNNTIEIYNRNGKLVYRASPYINTWDGKLSGSELPAATYYYVLDLGDGKSKITGSVAIIR